MSISPDLVEKSVYLPAKPKWNPGKIITIEGRRVGLVPSRQSTHKTNRLRMIKFVINGIRLKTPSTTGPELDKGE